MEKLTPFSYVKSINSKDTYYSDISEYVPFVVNRGFSYTWDTVLFANAMNMAAHIGKEMQYDFYFHGLDKKKRFGKWIKKENFDDLLAISGAYRCSISRAIEYSRILTSEQIKILRDGLEKGGLIK